MYRGIFVFSCATAPAKTAQALNKKKALLLGKCCSNTKLRTALRALSFGGRLSVLYLSVPFCLFSYACGTTVNMMNVINNLVKHP